MEVGAVYESDNADQGVSPPFDQFTFVVLESLHDVERGPWAWILVLDADGATFRPGGFYKITPSYWLWTGACELGACGL